MWPAAAVVLVISSRESAPVPVPVPVPAEVWASPTSLFKKVGSVCRYRYGRIGGIFWSEYTGLGLELEDADADAPVE